MDQYRTVKNEAEDEFVERRSRFIGRVKPVKTEEDAVSFIRACKSKYWDASHNVYAYSLREGSVRRYSDDGEPQGTAGVPVLEVLQKSGVTDLVVVVTRYFGGVLLGAGGLVRAYSDATAQALARASRVLVTRRHLWDVRVPVAQVSRLEADLRSRGDTGSGAVRVEETIWGPTHAVLMLSSGSSDPTRLHGLLAALTQGEAVPEPAGSRLTEVPVRPSSA